MSAAAHGPFEQCSPEEQERLIEAVLSASREEAGGVSDPALRGAVAEQREIDTSLERLFQAPGSDRVMIALRARMNEVEAPAPIARRDRAWWQRTSSITGLAASIVFATVGVILIVSNLSETDEHSDHTYVTREGSFFEVYDKEKALGFKEQWLCDTDAEFASYFYLDFGQAILLDKMPDGIAMLGLSYADTMSVETITMLGRVHGADVMLFIDSLDNDPGLPTEVPEGLNIFRRELGPLVIYEVTPLDEMVAAPFVRAVEMRQEWLPRGPGSG